MVGFLTFVNNSQECLGRELRNSGVPISRLQFAYLILTL